jgi:hypothetical protein
MATIAGQVIAGAKGVYQGLIPDWNAMAANTSTRC